VGVVGQQMQPVPLRLVPAAVGVLVDTGAMFLVKTLAVGLALSRLLSWAVHIRLRLGVVGRQGLLVLILFLLPSLLMAEAAEFQVEEMLVLPVVQGVEVRVALLQGALVLRDRALTVEMGELKRAEAAEEPVLLALSVGALVRALTVDLVLHPQSQVHQLVVLVVAQTLLGQGQMEAQVVRQIMVPLIRAVGRQDK